MAQDGQRREQGADNRGRARRRRRPRVLEYEHGLLQARELCKGERKNGLARIRLSASLHVLGLTHSYFCYLRLQSDHLVRKGFSASSFIPVDDEQGGL